MKNIILCSDGTGNQTIKDRGTNVFKLYEAVDRRHSTTQLAFYDDGVGTDNNKFLKILGGAFGFGLSRNVRHLYMELARCYQPGDNIYLFGFSRGAYTVRMLAGFIARCGVLDPRHCENDAQLYRYVKGAYKAYRRDYSNITTSLWRALFSPFTRLRYGFTRVEDITALTHEGGSTTVRFIGVWDTVSAVGCPIIGLASFIDRLIYKFRFPNNELSPKVEQACHALSIDDKRKTFHPEMWDERKETSNRIQQVWFSGVHANVGGGYPKQGMSLVALEWMMSKAQAAGLHFNQHDLEFYQQHADVHDKLYNSRSGINVYYRYAPRDIYAICQQYGIKPLIHETVYQRVWQLTEGYAPGNLPRDLSFVSNQGNGVTLQNVAAEIQQAMGDESSLLSRVAFTIALRKQLQLIFYLLTGMFIYLFLHSETLSSLLAMIFDADSLTLWPMLINALYTTGLLIPVFLLHWLSQVLRGRIQRVFSAFWYQFKSR